ncbi:hypothetical protein R1flu_022697 [Riccia fluitans]|uniref:Uncharacterized protein n=1 Tax=Riccia fluitans TaxID=41844 RepID=A0ABD1XQG9_9MARC
MAADADNPWVLSVYDLLQEEAKRRSDNSLGHDCPIYRLPQHIRKLKPHCYDSLIVSLGLYNRDFRSRTPMDRLKLEIVSIFLEYLGLLDPDGWDNFCAEVTTSSPYALELFYHDPPSDSFITSEVVRSMLTIDATFVAAFYLPEFIYVGGLGEFPSGARAFLRDLNGIFQRGSVWCHIDHLHQDISSLFENQAICMSLQRESKVVGWSESNFYQRYVAASRRTLPTASQLRRSGIRCRGVRTSVGDIRFVKSFFSLKAMLYLPKIDFQDYSEKVLLNLCVYEWMNTKIQRKQLIAYVQAMDDLINTEEDVQLLRKGDEPVISVNYLGQDKMVADLFNNPLRNFPSVRNEDFGPSLLAVFDEVHACRPSRPIVFHFSGLTLIKVS